jgi:superfamily II DNA or RNA helicase
MNIPEKSLKDLVLGLSDQIKFKVEKFFSPEFVPGEEFHRQVFEETKTLPRKPYLAQVASIAALLKGFKRKRALGLVGEMGVGKTTISIITAHLLAKSKKRPMRTLVVCPPTLISTWAEEVEASLGDQAVVINANEPDALAKLVRLRAAPIVPEKHEFWLIGINRVKTNAAWESRIVDHPRRGLSCPDCARSLSLFEEKDAAKSRDNVFKDRVRCPYCGSPLWSYKFDERRTYAPVSYIKNRLKRHFGLLIADEAHKFKGGDSIQGAVLGQLGEALPKTLILTGTLSGGKAGDVFYLLQRAYALNYRREERARKLPSFDSLQKFVDLYGSVEKTYHKGGEDMSTGRAYREKVSVRELPGVSPEMLGKFFLEHTVFLRISDISDALPGYSEILEFTELPQEVRDAYDTFESEVKTAATAAYAEKDMSVLGQMLAALLAWPDMPQKVFSIINKEKEIVAESEAMLIGQNTPKDERLIECVRDANDRGRNCLIFAEYTGFGALEYLASRLTDAGLRVLVMKPSIPTHKRLDWIRQKMASGLYDNLICHPKLVETGLNLREFPSIFFWQTGYSTFVLRQASRRSWRPGQEKDVEVRFFINRHTFQESAMTYIAQKLEAALLLEGELSDKGLVSLSGNNGISELARQLVDAASAGENLEKVFASYRAIENQARAAASQLNIEFEHVAGTAEMTETPSLESAQADSAGAGVISVPVAPATLPVSPDFADSKDLLARMRTMRLLGELFPKGQNAFIGKVKKKEFAVYDDSIIFGNEAFPLSGNFALAGNGDLGRALDFVLVKRPGLLDHSYMVYGAA